MKLSGIQRKYTDCEPTALTLTKTKPADSFMDPEEHDQKYKNARDQLAAGILK